MYDHESFGIQDGICSVFPPEQFNQQFNTPNKKLFIINFNIRSFSSNIGDFSYFLDELVRPPDLIVLTETWNTDDKSAEIEGYKSFHCNRSNDRIGGGVAIFVKNDLKAKSVKISMECLPEIEYIHVKVSFNNSTPVNIIGLYRPPNPGLLNSFFDYFDTLIDSIGQNNNKIIAGDLNICGLHNTVISNQLFNIMRSYSLMPHISRITRHNNRGSSTAIDHIWSNFGFNFQSGVFDDIYITDHYITFAFLPLLIENTKIKTRFRNHSDECIQKLFDGISNFISFFPLLSANLDFDSKFDLFYDELMRLYNNSCPIKVKEISQQKAKKPWISREIIEKIRIKHSIYRRYKNGDIPYHEFQTYQKDLQKLIKLAKQNYFKAKFESIGNNPKKRGN